MTGWNRRRFLQTTGLAGVSAAFVAACGGGDSKPTTSAGGGSSLIQGQATTVAANVPAPTRGGTIKIMTSNDNKRGADPMAPQAWSNFDGDFLRATYNNLLMTESGPGVPVSASKIVGDLVGKWEQPDPLTVTLRIADGAAWHDVAPLSGRKVTSTDVKYTFERMAASQFAYKSNWAVIKNIETPDAQTVKLNLGARDADFIAQLSTRMLYVIAPEAGKDDANAPLGKTYTDRATLIGTGPWIPEDYVADSVWKFKRNPNYFKKNLPYPDKFELYVLRDTESQKAAFLSKKIDLVGHGFTRFAIDDALDMEKAGAKRLTDYEVPEQIGYDTVFNFSTAPLGDVRVRQALQYAYDALAFQKSQVERKEAKDLIRLRVGILGAAFGDWYLPPEKMKPEIANLYKGINLTEANKLLDAAGITKKADGNRATLPYFVNNCCNTPTRVQGIVGLLAQAGVKFELQLQEQAVNLTTTQQNRFDGAGLVAPSPGPIINSRFNLYRKSGNTNPFGVVEDAKLLALIDDQWGDLDTGSRMKKVHAIQEYIAEQVFGLAMTDSAVSLIFWPNVNGVGGPKDRHYENYWLTA